jgi:uncharacterized protein YgbK (DUF1537 family)
LLTGHIKAHDFSRGEKIIAHDSVVGKNIIMIAVIADDFTGAAEIGGVGLRYGLRVLIETTAQKSNTADLLIIATDSRSLSPGQSAEQIKKITSQLLELKPDFIYKKIDSVLRGNIAPEINSQMAVVSKKKAVLIAGNPGLGRIIRNGTYYINDVPLDQTFFADDPEFPRNSSSVTDIIGTNNISVVSKSVNEELPEAGIIVGNVTSQSDMAAWVERINDDILAAGGAGFFDVILSRLFPGKKEVNNDTYYLSKKSLFVMGSLYPKSEKMIRKIGSIGLIRMNMPEAIYQNKQFSPGLIDRWAEDIIRQLKGDHKVVVTIEHQYNHEAGVSKRIRENIGQLIQRVMKLVHIDDLFIEGGATTYEILKQLNIKKLHPFREMDLGIIQMKVDEYPDLCITTKPGSYSWPDSVEFQDM